MSLSNGRSFLQEKSQVLLLTDASRKGWGATCLGVKTGGQCQKQGVHINHLELLAIKLAILTFSKSFTIKSFHISIDNKTALSYLVKMGGITSLPMSKLSKEIWEHLFLQQITVTAEYLSGILNVIAESRNTIDRSEWKLKPKVFQAICQKIGCPEVDLFASRLFYQIKNILCMETRPLGTDALQQNWSHHHLLYAFPPFSLIQKVLQKVRQENVPLLIIVTPTWPGQCWYPELLCLSVRKPLLIQSQKDLLLNPQGESHRLFKNKKLHLVAWVVSGLDWRQKEFQRELPVLYQQVEGTHLLQLTHRPEISGLVGVVKGKLIHFDVTLRKY